MPPIKFNDNNSNDDYLSSVPITEIITTPHNDTTNKDTTQNNTEDMLREIVRERIKMKNTSILEMVGVLTTVTYYRSIKDPQNNYASDSNGPNQVAMENKKYDEITKFKVKINGAANFGQEGDEENKSYESSGSLIILPRTIKPVEGDLFIMSYYGRNVCYKISTVDTKTFEQDSGFECQYVQYKEDYTVPSSMISSRYIYFHEFVGTTYRPILTSREYDNIQHLSELFNHISQVFNDLFYDKIINGYLLKSYDYEKNIKSSTLDNNNINTLGKHGGIFRGNNDRDSLSYQNMPRIVNSEDIVYDNMLNHFMTKNRIFRKYDGMLLSVEALLNLDRVSYKRSIFNCLETQTVANFKNTFVSPVNIGYMQHGVPSYLVGKKNVIYSNTPIANIDKEHVFPENLTNKVINGKKIDDMRDSCVNKIYNSVESMIIETIVRFIYKENHDFIDRFEYLYNNIDKLYEHDMDYSDIYYLFPMLGYVIDKSLDEIYSDNILLR